MYCISYVVGNGVVGGGVRIYGTINCCLKLGDEINT